MDTSGALQDGGKMVGDSLPENRRDSVENSIGDRNKDQQPRAENEKPPVNKGD
jgi:hypothetical protein